MTTKECFVTSTSTVIYNSTFIAFPIKFFQAFLTRISQPTMACFMRRIFHYYWDVLLGQASGEKSILQSKTHFFILLMYQEDITVNNKKHISIEISRFRFFLQGVNWLSSYRADIHSCQTYARLK